ncbi:F0F1 ATP synthase subunit delta [Photobacterium lipolyticum]|uniref:ATP synthase subunit b n=1 Tax=Photobacterium lipolyticum TaxID=266810 RepID=A0A2T3MWV4_9GAMM|nr:F0F1 ATP synthase subunit delta [Photobacterium lipolyticum]PSW04450.1 ATPase [Photobacterium lipolyticum]
MELSWSTFLLEIVNFLVLVWILKHFLFKPVMAVITQRRTGIEEQLAESQRLNDESTVLKKEYKNRLADWEHECQLARTELMEELNAERQSKLNLLKQTLEQEREKARVAESRQLMEATREIEYQALQQSAQFASSLLSKASGPELEIRLLDILLDDLSSLSSEYTASLRLQWGELPEAIMITSVYPLPDNKRQELEKVLATITQLSVPVHYDQEPELIAGLRVTIGAWRLHANVRDDLKGFAEFAYASK